MLLKWSAEYSVDIKEIDDQHKTFFDIINEVLNNRDNKELLEKSLNKLSDYAKYHFAVEENYFDEFHYKDVKKHKFMHRKYVEKIEEFKKKLKENDMSFAFELIDFLENWLIQHILTEDKKYMKCFHDHGL